jgi:DNA-binding IscR family transcriptional regulator
MNHGVLALVVAGRIAARQYSDAPRWTSQALASTLRIPGVHDRPDPAVKIVEQKVQAAINSALSGYTLKDLVQHTADERHAETGHDTERAASG